jgi:hypothetical protein
MGPKAFWWGSKTKKWQIEANMAPVLEGKSIDWDQNTVLKGELDHLADHVFLYLLLNLDKPSYRPVEWMWVSLSFCVFIVVMLGIFCISLLSFFLLI